MVTKKNQRSTGNGKSNGANKGGSGKGESKGRNYLLYGGLAVAAVYGLSKIPILRSLTLPIVATAATKYFQNMKGRMQMA